MRTSLLIILLAVCGLFAGCNRPAMPTASMPTPTVETHIERRDRSERDSIFIRDSVRVFEKADTVFVIRDRWRDRFLHVRDTVLRRDSIPYPVEVVRTERYVPTIYRWSLWLALAAVGWILFKVFRG